MGRMSNSDLIYYNVKHLKLQAGENKIVKFKNLKANESYILYWSSEIPENQCFS